MHRLAALVVVMVALTGSRARGDDVAAPDPTGLYQTFGEKPGIVALVDDFVARALKDERMRGRFDPGHVQHFKDMVVDQICQGLGGPCVYRGKSMRESHLGMGISDAEYDALTEDMVAALDARHIPKEAQRRFLAIRDVKRNEIVEVPATAGAHAAAPETAAATDAVLRRAQDLIDAAKLLQLADAARQQGNASLAGRLFSSAELVVGGGLFADLRQYFPSAVEQQRARTPLGQLPPSTPPQPRGAGASDDETHAAEPTRATVSGTLTGTLTLGGKPALLGIGLVTLAPLDRRARTPSPRKRTLEQRGRAFAPHLLIVAPGSTVSFPNFDPIFHNVYSSSPAKTFDLGVYRNGQSRDITFDKPGIVHVQCNLHANMTAYVAVVSEPYAVAAEESRFAFRALPPGRYRLRAWTELGGKTIEKNVEVRAGKNVLGVALDDG
jgi:truncated hemoglobin YjbI/plastocyanin